MRTGRKNFKIIRIIGTILIAIGILSVFALVCFDLWIRPTLDTAAVYQCERIADRAVSRAVIANSETTQDEAAELISFLYDSEGRIQALKTNPAAINRLKALLSEAINDELNNSSNSERVSVSIGTLTGISYLRGLGSDLEFTVRPIGSVDTKLISGFSSAGINQTVHSITLEVSTVISPLIPGFTEQINVSTDFILAETVLIGKVPDTFSNIILDEEHASELADFNLTG